MLKIIKYELDANDDLLIAHLSDIHYSNNFDGERLEELVSNLKKLKPNYICVSGDIVDNLGVTNNKKMARLLSFLEDLAEISKLIICLGNHDTRDYKGIKDNKWYKRLNKNVIVLDDDMYEDSNICFYGITVQNEYYIHESEKVNLLYKKLSSIKFSADKYNILLFHSPINFNEEAIKEINKFDLVLTGHTHNGLTPHFVPGNFGFIGPHHGIYLKNARNHFKSGKSEVIISGGITKLSEGTGLLHIFNKFYASDLNLIYLKKSKKN